METTDSPDTDSKPINPQAYPQAHPSEHMRRMESGMTLKDYFAGQVMAEYIRIDFEAMKAGDQSTNTSKAIAEMSYMMAEAMLAERVKRS